MAIHISCDMYLRLGLHVQIRLYYVLPYKAKISAQHGIGFILGRCIVYLGLTMPNLQKKRLLTFEIFNIKKCTLSFRIEYNKSSNSDFSCRNSPPPPPKKKKTNKKTRRMPTDLVCSLSWFDHNVIHAFALRIQPSVLKTK